MDSPITDTIGTAEPIKLTHPVGGRHPRLLVHNRSETVSNFVREYKIWQRAVTMFILSYLKPSDVFVDVGANIGYFTVYAAMQVGDHGKVHAVEPDSGNATILRNNIGLNGLGNVQVHQLAVADTPGEATLFRSGFNAGAHSLLPKTGLAEGPKVQVTTLDALLGDDRLPKLIKIDVQGAELGVLQSMSRLLTRSLAKPAIIMEFSPIELARQGSLDGLFAFVAKNGYTAHAFIANERRSVIPPQLRRATLRCIADDLLQGNDDAEFDLLLLPHT